MHRDIAQTLAEYTRNSREIARIYPIIYIRNPSLYYVITINGNTYLCRNIRPIMRIPRPIYTLYNDWIYISVSSDSLYTIIDNNLSITWAYGGIFYWCHTIKKRPFNYYSNGKFAEINKLIEYYKNI